MKRVVLTVLGEDRPGIVHAVARALSEQSCEILEVSQNILQGEFAALFVVGAPEGMTREDIKGHLIDELAPLGMQVWAKDLTERQAADPEPSEPFVITLRGLDRPDIIAGMTGVIAGFNVNIEELKALPSVGQPGQAVIYFIVSVPVTVNRSGFRAALAFKAEELGMDLSVQHRDIFEAIHRI